MAVISEAVLVRQTMAEAKGHAIQLCCRCQASQQASPWSGTSWCWNMEKLYKGTQILSCHVSWSPWNCWVWFSVSCLMGVVYGGFLEDYELKTRSKHAEDSIVSTIPITRLKEQNRLLIEQHKESRLSPALLCCSRLFPQAQTSANRAIQGEET